MSPEQGGPRRSTMSGKAPVRQRIGAPVRRAVRQLGYDVVRVSPGPHDLAADIDEFTANVIERVSPYTMTSVDRIVALVDAVRYLVRAGVPGAFVECGVWRGGSMMAVALTLADIGATDRDLFLFDTFTHMPEPGIYDVTPSGAAWADLYDQAVKDERYRYLPLNAVKTALESTRYPTHHMTFVQGLVEDTIPSQAPSVIALCRLDTDWYDSTRHEMLNLWPRIAPGGVLIVDDYGEFPGCKKAVDEYFRDVPDPLLLHRIDSSGRLVLKP